MAFCPLSSLGHLNQTGTCLKALNKCEFTVFHQAEGVLINDSYKSFCSSAVSCYTCAQLRLVPGGICGRRRPQVLKNRHFPIHRGSASALVRGSLCHCESDHLHEFTQVKCTCHDSLRVPTRNFPLFDTFDQVLALDQNVVRESWRHAVHRRGTFMICPFWKWTASITPSTFLHELSLNVF